MHPAVIGMAEGHEVPEVVRTACRAGQDVVRVVGPVAADFAAALGPVEAPAADLPPAVTGRLAFGAHLREWGAAHQGCGATERAALHG